jgi:hypothetical protein
MLSKHDKLADKLLRRSNGAVEVDPETLQEIFDAGEPGWTALEEPEGYRYFLIKEFPVNAFDVTLKSIIRDADPDNLDEEQEIAQHNRIVEILQAGEVAWPVIVTSSGVILDGYHRIAAHRTLKLDNINVVVAVDRPGEVTARGDWERHWNNRFPA